MNCFILTSNKNGLASLCVPELVKNTSTKLIHVIVVESLVSNQNSRLKKIKRILRKTRKIGLFGALNGVRMRKWYLTKRASNIYDVCKQHNVNVITVNGLNSIETENIIKDINADFGISLSNSYIAPRIFETPKMGMINVHTELLPDYPGAQSIIWPIYNLKTETGFTIHKIANEIDKGDILYVDRTDIQFHSDLSETVEANLKVVRNLVPSALAKVAENFQGHFDNATVQTPGISRTTPSLREFLRIRKNHSKLYTSKNADNGV